MSLTDGLDAAAKREKELHPTTDKGAPITAWERRAATLKEHANAIVDLGAEFNDLADRVAVLEARPSPFPF